MEWKFFFYKKQTYAWSSCNKYIIQNNGETLPYIVERDKYEIYKAPSLDIAIMFCEKLEERESQ